MGKAFSDLTTLVVSEYSGGTPIWPLPDPPDYAVRSVFSIDHMPDGPTWIFAVSSIKVAWQNLGGDWLDANSDPQGTVNFGQSTPLGDTIWNLAPSLITLLKSENTGLLIKAITGGPVNYASSRNTNGYPIPRLSVLTTAGVFDCTLLADTFIASSAGSPDASGSLKTGSGNTLLKFDVSAITGTVQSATLRMYVTGTFFPPPGGVGVFYLNMPRFYSDPASELPAGILRGLSEDTTTDADLASDPDILFYGDFDAGFLGVPNPPSTIGPVCEWDKYAPSYSQTWGLLAGRLPDNTPQEEYVYWDDYQAYALRMVSNPNGPGILNQWIYMSPLRGIGECGVAGRDYQVPIGELTSYHELYFRCVFMLEEDLATGLWATGSGFKLPGMVGSYEFEGSLPWPSGSPTYSVEAITTSYSESMPLYVGCAGYIYDNDWAGAQTANNTPLFAFKFKLGQKYNYEQRFVANTFSGATPNRDGLYEVYVDGVLMARVENLPLISYEAMGVNFCQLRFGSGASADQPRAPFHIQVGCVAIARQYIGPAKVVA